LVCRKFGGYIIFNDHCCYEKLEFCIGCLEHNCHVLKSTIQQVKLHHRSNWAWKNGWRMSNTKMVQIYWILPRPCNVVWPFVMTVITWFSNNEGLDQGCKPYHWGRDHFTLTVGIRGKFVLQCKLTSHDTQKIHGTQGNGTC
jgi:hypothetical protein